MPLRNQAQSVGRLLMTYLSKLFIGSPRCAFAQKKHVARREPEPGTRLFQGAARAHEHLSLIRVDETQRRFGGVVRHRPMLVDSPDQDNCHLLAIELLGEKPP